MAARTRVLIFVLLSVPFGMALHAQESTDSSRSKAPSQGIPAWRVTEVRTKFSIYEQRGQGYQSLAGPPQGPGSEQLLVLQPMALIGLEQNERLTHQVVVPIDIVSAASVDAIDVMTSASRVNEAGGLDITSTYRVAEPVRVSARYGFHIEEPLRSAFAGLAVSHDFAQRNTTALISANAFFDYFNHYTFDGDKDGKDTKQSFNGNFSLSQVLSPTTLAHFNYGFTYQTGTLQTVWNSVPFDSGDTRMAEIFPKHRFRQAWSTEFAQHVPLLRSTAKLGYRYYRDSFALSGHTMWVFGYQYLSREVYVRGSYRYHVQNGVEFFRERFTESLDEGTPRTSDSDLARLFAHEVGLRCVLPLDVRLSDVFEDESQLDLSYVRYMRSNDLDIDIVSLGYSRQF